MSSKSLILLFVQFLTMGFLLSRYVFSTNIVIIGVEVFGMVIALWAVHAGGIHEFNMQPEVKSDVLITDGPFQLVRNPMYLGVLLFLAASTYANPSYLAWILYGVLVLVLILKIHSEEHYLEEKFGSEYRSYKKRTFRLLPYIL